MRLLRCLACLTAVTATAAPARSARLLLAEDVPASGSGEAPPLVNLEPAPAPAPSLEVAPLQAGPQRAPPASSRNRSTMLLWGLVTPAAMGVAVPGVVIFAAVLTAFSSYTSVLGPALLLGGVGLAWVVTPLLVTWAMEGFPVGGRAALEALAGWAAGGLLAGVLWVTPLSALGAVIALAGPGIGTAVAIHTAPDADFLPPEDRTDVFGVRPSVVPVVSLRI